ncbi:3-carboxy-cis,cis-muconate cycloisomerase [Paucibacter sp. R3-3]|uniref:3-carboxy-cis,cis-muconate cycloisomerase n=1 Tax=Roseateles agri TaxID=3098619 RepID=A0ABU5DNT3_9BURK|nr:3-carboxy-cis,cis-muconate cycloisomerase [Paucibacter sp. R3-3]MDY0747391.1 3-carboxy-cis,cis-muconate cycloisomerase [Paucibacter sp. R3-3]
MNPFEGFLSTAEIGEVFGQEAIVQRMLDFEAALARAQGDVGLVPQAAADEIARHCRAEFFNAATVVAASRTAGSLAIPLVKQLTERVAAHDAEAGRYVHWGSTSQDVVDTAMVLATRQALALITADLDALIASLRKLYEQHGAAPVLARSLMQPAQVISFGFKLAAWTAPLLRARERIGEAAERGLQLQFGGAVGTLSAMGEQGPAVAAKVAEALGLRLPPTAWHTQRDEWLTLGAQVGILCGSLGKIARDWSLMAQGEIGELAEPSGGGRGGSSAMPHKRNPVSSLVALAAAGRVPQRVAGLLAAMDQEHERGLGNWQAELAEWVGLFVSTHGAVRALAEAAAGLTVDAVQMRANIDRLQGLVFAEALSMRLAKAIGKAKAHHVIEQWSQTALREKRPLKALVDLSVDPTLTPQELDALFDADRAAQPAIAIAARQFDGWGKKKP